MTQRVVVALAWPLALFLIGRAIAEPFSIDFGNPASYASDWGGPSLPGVLAVHMVPGVVAAWWVVHRLRRRTARS